MLKYKRNLGPRKRVIRGLSNRCRVCGNSMYVAATIQGQYVTRKWKCSCGNTDKTVTAG